MEFPTDLRTTSLSCIFYPLLGDTPLGHIFFAYAQMGIFGPYVGNPEIQLTFNISKPDHSPM